MVAKYAERGILTQVDGIDEVTDRVLQTIKAHREPEPGQHFEGSSRHLGGAFLLPVDLPQRRTHPSP